MRKCSIASILAAFLLGNAAAVAQTDPRPNAQLAFEKEYVGHAEHVIELSETEEKNQFRVTKLWKGLEEEERDLRAARAATGWSCKVDEVFEQSVYFDSRLIETAASRTSLVICSTKTLIKGIKIEEEPEGQFNEVPTMVERRVQYLLLYRPSKAKLLEGICIGENIKFSGTLNVLNSIGQFHTDVLGPTFFVRANDLQYIEELDRNKCPNRSQ